jgi:hypothetical protein
VRPRLRHGRPQQVRRALTVPPQRATLTYDRQDLARDLPDLISLLVATGCASIPVPPLPTRGGSLA